MRGEDHPRQVVEVGRERLRVVRLAPQVHLAAGVLHELADELGRPVAGEEELEERAQDAQQDGVAVQGLADARLDHLDDHRVPFERRRPVDLGDRGRAGGDGVDPGVHLRDRPLDVPLDQPEVAVEGDHRQPVEQVLELVGDGRRQDVLPQGEHLAQLDVGGAQDLQPPPQLHGERPVGDRPVQKRPHQGRQQALEEEQQPEPPALCRRRDPRGHGPPGRRRRGRTGGAGW